MSRKLFAFLLGDLKTIRLICQQCHAATELTVDQVAGRNSHSCPACHATMNAAVTLKELAKAIETLQRSPGFDVEFTVPDEG